MTEHHLDDTVTHAYCDREVDVRLEIESGVVFGQPLDSGEGFSLMSVESTEMCDPVRGVSQSGESCV